MSEKTNRRDFLVKLGIGAGGVGIGTQAAASLRSLLQISDIVLLANRLGAPNFSRSAGLVHPDWRWAYYLVLLVFYILVTFASEKVFAALNRWAGRGMSVASHA